MKLPVHLYNGIIQNNSQIVTYHFDQQTVFFPAIGTRQLQGQYPHTMLASPCFYPQRQETPFHDTAPLHLSRIVTPLETFIQFFLILFRGKTCRFQVSGFLVIHSQCQILQQQHLVQLVKHAPYNPVQHLITESFRTRSSRKDGTVHHKHLLHIVTIMQPMAKIKCIIGYQTSANQQHEQRQGNTLVAGRTLHLQTIFFQRIVLTQTFVKSRVSRIVIAVFPEIFYGQGSHSRLITHIQQNKIIRIERLGQPGQLCSLSFTLQPKQRTALSRITKIVGIHIIQYTVG